MLKKRCGCICKILSVFLRHISITYLQIMNLEDVLYTEIEGERERQRERGREREREIDREKEREREREREKKRGEKERVFQSER